MRILMTVAAVAVASLGLTACQNSKLDAAIAQNLPKICDGSAQIHAAFAVVSRTGTVSPKVVNKERAAWAAISRICTSNVTSATALVVAAEAFADLTVALKEAKE